MNLISPIQESHDQFETIPKTPPNLVPEQPIGGGLGSKIQKVKGTFSGESQCEKRVEQREKHRSYKEALNPNVSYEDGGKERVREAEEFWDGSLLSNNEADMAKGVSVSEVNGGLCIDFSEEENLRLERNHSSSSYWEALSASCC